MPSLQSQVVGRGMLADIGLAEQLQSALTLTSHASLAAAETFTSGLLASLRSGPGAGVFLQGPYGPPAQGSGPNDTVPGGVGTSFVLTIGGPSQNGRVN